MRISVEGKWGVVDGASFGVRKHLCRCLNTETKTVGDRLKFIPTREVLDYLAHQGQFDFDPACRTVWGHFYTRKRAPQLTPFDFRTEPYPHQRDEWEKSKDKAFYGLFWEMGLGKTKTALDIAAWKHSRGEIDGLLVVTLKGVHRNWVTNEIPEHLPVRDFYAAYWNPNRVEAGMRGVLEAQGLAIAAVNFDTVHQKRGESFCKRFLAERKTLLIVDESHAMKTPSAQRTKALLRFGKKAKARLIMTGTPMTNSPLDLWPQFHFLSASILNCKNYYLFKKRYAVEKVIPGVTHLEWRRNPRTGKSEQVEVPTKTVVGYKNMDELRSLIEPHSSRLTKDEVLDLPEKVYRLHSFEMTQQQRTAYRKMKEDLVIELADERRVTAQLAITKLLRLQQLACGFVMPDDADRTDPNVVGEPFGKNNPRLQALIQVIEEVHHKVIIWAHYRYSLIEIVDALKDIYGKESVVGYSGMTPDDARQRAVEMFQDPNSPVRFFVGQPQAGGTGITLTQARDVIYYTNSFQLAQRLQSEDRAHRIGQTGTVTYTDLEAIGTIDRHVIKALKSKRDLAAEITGDDLKSWLSEDV